MKKIFTLLLTAGIAFASYSQATHLTISQVYINGGSASATFTHKYIELYNPTANPINLADYSVAYVSATGTSYTNNTVLSGVLPANGYYLIQGGSNGSNGSALPTPNQISALNPGNAGGKFVLKLATATATCPGTDIVDFFAWGTANCSETAPATGHSVILAYFRGNSGGLDTDNNSTDFTTGTPSPRSTVLPIKFGAYNLSVVNNNVVINWETKFEQNVNEFSVERSANGTEFSTVGTVAATNKVEGSKYNFTDVNPIEGVSYYRIKSTDFDGKTSYTKTLVANTKKVSGIKLFGNPVRNNIVLSHDKAARGSVIRIYNSIGSLLQTINVQEGATQTSGDVSKLISGSYLAIFEANGVKQNVQFVKQ